ncbi:DUF262 domain-containing protein [Planomonospora venezuelensis]|uniref:GmrSD restriction endonucleases N-terminal domain-containing protein n=1 Tax=Planomonospora venezuelensis TaxID=1999 RepID=A0A841D4U2_PLAVE|nr:DUF262 domain-containing protein [Planomonospora venezuelensis]MBB5963185.1 hypothetical protein [Planomonospora venezuelensis]GIN00062.1 hypothetical protein Pve01_17200 [Planomonospora venezuelensis]
MSTGLGTRPSATTYDVEKLVGMAWQGQIRVPHFQRGLRWGREDVIRLFDSIIKGYPIGSLLLWVRPAAAQRITFGALRINAPRLDHSLWVVDGQQRVTSLANALHEDAARDPRFALAYDLREEKLAPLPAIATPHVIPLPTLFDLRRVLTWFAQNPEVADLQDRAFHLTAIIRQYPVPAYHVEQEDAEVLQDIFDRMNNYGKRLSRAEIFSALNAGPEGTTPLTLGEIAEHIDEDLSFGRIDNDTVLYAILARRGHDVQREIRLEFDDENRRGVSDFPGEDRDAAFRAGEEALREAVTFLRQDAGVPHVTLLPFRYLLVVLARLFGHFPDPDPANRRLLRRWFWRAALVGPEIFRGSTTGAVRALCAKIHPGDLTGSVQNLLEAVDRPAPPLPELRRFKTNEAAAKITLCSWWELDACDPTSGDPAHIRDLAECLIDRPTPADAVRYIVPSRQVAVEQRLWAANRVLVPVVRYESGKEIGHHLLHSPLGEEDVFAPFGSRGYANGWRTILRSHLVTPEMVELLRRGEIEDFLKARQEAILRHLDSFLHRMCEWDFEDTPPLAELLMEDLPGEEPALSDEDSYGPA